MSDYKVDDLVGLIEKEKTLEKLSIIISRSDGIILSSLNVDSSKAQSIAALSAGVWQASEAVSLAQGASLSGDPSLSFASSDTGFYICPISMKNEQIYLCAMYSNVINPAVLKHKLKLVKKEFENLFSQVVNTRNENNERDNFLFEEISDEEVDQLFTGLGN